MFDCFCFLDLVCLSMAIAIVNIFLVAFLNVFRLYVFIGLQMFACIGCLDLFYNAFRITIASR